MAVRLLFITPDYENMFFIYLIAPIFVPSITQYIILLLSKWFINDFSDVLNTNHRRSSKIRFEKIMPPGRRLLLTPGMGWREGGK